MKARDEEQIQRRDGILTAAGGVFSDFGYAYTTMEAVADRAGISKGSIYNYFHNKQDLFKHVFLGWVSSLDAEFQPVLEMSIPAAAKIEQIIDHWYSRLEYFRPMSRLILEFWATAARESQAGDLTATFQELYARFRSQIAEVLRAGVAAGEFGADLNPVAGAAMIVAMLDGIVVQTLLGFGLVVDEELVKSLKKAILAALRAGTTGIADCGLNGKGNDVGATSRAASVSASGTPTGGYGKT